MSKFTLDEAIEYCEEEIEQAEKKADYRPRMDLYDEIESRAECLKRAADYRQLAEWLRELKEAKRLLKLAIEDLNNIGSCRTCVKFVDICKGCRTDYRYVHADEAEKLLKEENKND